MTAVAASLAIVLGTLLALAAVPGHAQAPGEGPAEVEMEGAESEEAEPDDGLQGLICIVSGYDLVLRNEGADPIPAGTVIAWGVPYARREGQHELAEDIAPGGQLFLTAVMGATYLDPRKPCTLALASDVEMSG